MDDTVLLDVCDDGAGFAAGRGAADGRPSQGFGLAAMRQRLQRVAGGLEIESAPGEGTAVNARVPAISAEAGG
jgi:signal transduction histidine kinase